MATITTTVLTERSQVQGARTNKQQTNEPKLITLTVLRILLICFIYVSYINSDLIQQYINIMWKWIRHQWWFKSVYFETVLVQAYSFPAVFPYRFIHTIGIGEKYRIDKVGGVYHMPTYKDIMWEVFEYSWPLVVLDTFHVKQYVGVPQELLSEKRADWIQRTRGLPEAPPLLGDMVRHLLVGLVLYDLCFFLVHYSFHKNATCYRLFHSVHHEHPSVYAKVANQLHVVERVLLVLSANFGLKIQGAHPLTRTFFVFIFLSALIDNHSGYDFPYSYDKILPQGLIAGSRRHYEHHMHGTRYYQPYFRYIDDTLEWFRKRKKKSS